jgi:phosphodiesterase/alkaline phosphatase D-like protein
MVQLIIGHITSDKARIWVKGEDDSISANISLSQKGGSARNILTPLISKEYDTAVVDFTGLSPETFYECNVSFERGTEVVGSFTTMPETTESFNFLLGSCHFSQGTDHFSPEFNRIAELAKQENSLFQINCGDQIYIDTAIRPFWVTSEQGYKERYEETWHSEPLKKLFGNLPQYMAIDDHEIFNDFSNNNLSPKEQQWFDWAQKTYRIFQHSHNPGNYQGQLYYSFECAHASFFVMDLRTGRKGNNMISDQQFSDLVFWINDENTTGKIKILVSSVPFITQLIPGPQNDKWSGGKYVEQRDRILQIMMEASNKKIVLLSGDIHLSSHAWIEYESQGKTYRINELISSPIKQLQSNLLDHTTPTAISVNGKQVKYFLGNHMGYPVTAGKRYALRNNIMSIDVKPESLSYRVYALNSEDMVFEGDIIFKTL